jgi:hypothetical protein
MNIDDKASTNENLNIAPISSLDKCFPETIKTGKPITQKIEIKLVM